MPKLPPCFNSFENPIIMSPVDFSTRRRFLMHLAQGTALAVLPGELLSENAVLPPPHAPKVENGIAWFDVQSWGVEGRGWASEAMDRFYARLPGKARGVVREPVWNLSQHSAGMLTRFRTDAQEIHVRYKLTSANLEMPHMPATGVSGIDLYAMDEKAHWRWVDVFRPGNSKTGDSLSQSGKLTSGLDHANRVFSAYLPLYNGIDSLEFGVAEKSKFEPISPRRLKPIVFYGTSITHGACASRPGMCHTAILGRMLDRPVINLGFSGNGTMDPEVGALLTEVDAAAYVIDCLPNMEAKQVAERTVPLVQLIRQVRSETPIILVEDRTYANAWIRRSSRERHETSRSALIHAYDTLVEAKVGHLHYLKGDDLLGRDDEGTTDGSHPNDLGFVRQSEVFAPVLRQALGS